MKRNKISSTKYRVNIIKILLFNNYNSLKLRFSLIVLQNIFDKVFLHSYLFDNENDIYERSESEHSTFIERKSKKLTENSFQQRIKCILKFRFENKKRI